MNKTLKYNPFYIETILKNGVSVDVRLFDDKNLSVGDVIDLLNGETGEKFATGTITAIRETIFKETVKGGADRELYEKYEKLYGRDVKPTDVAKIVRVDLIKDK